MNKITLFVTLLIGIIPFLISKKRASGRTVLEIQAVSWSLQICCYRDRCDWTLRIPLVSRMRNVFWKLIAYIYEEHARIQSSEECPQRLQTATVETCVNDAKGE